MSEHLRALRKTYTKQIESKDQSSVHETMIHSYPQKIEAKHEKSENKRNSV